MDTLATSDAVVTRARRAVIKVGSALLVDAKDGSLNVDWLNGLADDIADLRRTGCEVVVVSSGAIALGRAMLSLPAGELSLEMSQAAAAVGQTRLVEAWQQALSRHGLNSAQVLLTLYDTQNRRRYLNGRATLAALLDVGAIPVVNENDTVATDEIRYGDNDRLAARVALMTDADLLVLLSDVDGLYESDPRQVSNAHHIPLVTQITAEIDAMAGGSGTATAKGGMRTKLMAAKTAMQGGCAMAIVRGDVSRPLQALANGARHTLFQPQTEPTAARKRWIAGMKPMGQIHVDDGAAAAVVRGKSLLPAGVVEVSGTFDRGDPVTVLNASSDSIGAALIGYNAEEARAIAGRQTDQIAGILGYPGRTAMIHANDMVIWGT